MTLFEFAGEGTTGDMQFTHGNLAIRDHLQNRKTILLFSKLGYGKYECEGEFVCQSWYLQDSNDMQGDIRKAIIFELVPIESLSNVAGPEVENIVDLDTLRQRAITDASQVAQSRTSQTPRNIYRRSQSVGDYARARAKGFCELCNMPAPFVAQNGEPFLEVHHLDRVSDGGPDHIDAVGAIRPNCPRRVHNGKDGIEVNEFLRERIVSKENVRAEATEQKIQPRI